MSSTREPKKARRRTWRAWFAAAMGVGLAAFALVVEAILWGRLAAQTLGFGTALIFHLLLSSFLTAVGIVHHRQGGDSRSYLLLAATTWTLGPFGPAGVLLVASLNRWYERVAQPFQEWYDALFPEEEETLSERVFERVRRTLEEGVESAGPTPFADLLQFGSLAEKQAVLATVSKRFRPAFAPILRMALQDPTNAVRVQAATAIAVVESRFSERIQELTQNVETASADRARAAALLELARWYDDYAFTGLLDREREDNNRSRALATYDQYLSLEPDDADVRLAAGRVMVRDTRYRDAVEWLERAFPEGFPDAKAALWYMEALYHLGRFSDLRRLAEQYASDFESDADAFPAIALEAVQFWAAAPPPSQHLPEAATAPGLGL